MSTEMLVALVIAVAFVSLGMVLLLNRPWSRQQKLFALSVLAITLWAVSDFLFRSSFFANNKLFLLQITGCLFIWSAVQTHYFLTSFYENKAMRIPYAYILMLALMGMVLTGYVVDELRVENGVLIPVYQSWIFVLPAVLVLLFGRDFYLLYRRLQAITDPLGRNQIMYLLFGIVLLACFSTLYAFSDIGKRYPVANVGALLTIATWSYAVLRHRLLDLQIVLRRALAWVTLIVAGVTFYACLLALFYWLAGKPFDWLVFGGSVISAAVIAGVAYGMHNLVFTGMEQLFVGRKGRTYRLRLLHFVSNELSRTSNLAELAQKLLPLVVGSLGARSVALLLPTPNDGSYVASFVEPRSTDVSSLSISKYNPIVRWLKRECRYLLRDEIEALPEFMYLGAGVKSQLEALDLELLFPLIHDGNLTAILTLGRKKRGRYSAEDIGFLESITRQLAANLEKEYFHEQLRKREQELALINELVRVITSSLNIQEVYSAFVAELKKVVDVDWAAIVLLDKEELVFEALFATTVGSPWRQGDRIPLKGTGTEWALKHRKALFEPDLAGSRKFWTGDMHVEQGVSSIVYLPLISKGEPIGGMIIASRKPNAYTREQVLLLERLAAQIAVPVENSRLYARAEQRARVDEVTELFNRRHFDERLKQEIDLRQRYGGTFSLILLDLDLFKAYNDVHGHAAGDRLLAEVGQIIQRSVRSTDLAFRYDGDTFAVLLPQTDSGAAFVVAERIRGKIAQEMSKVDPRITASIGLATWPNDGVMPDGLLSAADKALYYAKKTGGDRTCVVSRILSAAVGSILESASDKEALNVIYALAATIEAKDRYTYGHSRKVTNYAVALAEKLNLSPEKVAVISTAALLHDIGKIGIPDEVLNKPGALDAQAWEMVRAHPKLSTTIVSHVLDLVSCVPAILHHHERWDGTGYPTGLKGENIPIEARILAIADAFDAMTSSRPYRGALSYQQAIAELKQCSGSQFDPQLVEAFLPIAHSTFTERL